MRFARLVSLALAILTSALISGFFYAYHCSVMPGLAATDAETAIKAMQAINVVVRNATFALSFLGTLVLACISVILLIGAGARPLGLAILGAALYGFGAFAVTLLYSVPLNEGLARVAPASGNAAQIWQTYLDPWMFWNALRALMSMLALIALIASFVSLLMQPYAAVQRQRA